jgi:hypothetical protein
MFKNPKRWHRTLGLYIFFVGILLGMFFAMLLTSANLEAFLFSPVPDSSAQPLESLRCPILLNRGETGTISATFSNPSDQTRRRTVDTYTSRGSIIMMEEGRDRFDLAPGEKHTLKWSISADDAAWGWFIIARIYVQRNLPLPSRSGGCGVLVFNLPFGTGAQITGAIVGASLLLMIGGALLWLKGGTEPRKALRTVEYLVLALGPATVLALLFSMTGLWLVSAILLVLMILAVVTVVTWVLS